MYIVVYILIENLEATLSTFTCHLPNAKSKANDQIQNQTSKSLIHHFFWQLPQG